MQSIYKIIYHPTVNSILLLINRMVSPFTTFRLPPSGTITLKTGEAIHFKMATNQTSYVTKLLYWKNAMSFEYTPVFLELIKNCKSFFDVGANTGYYSLLATQANRTIKVHAFEPSSGPLHYLKQNVLINKLQQQVVVNSIALSSSEGEAIFYEVPNQKYKYLEHNLGGVGSLKQDNLKKQIIVKTETLDHFVSFHQVAGIDLIKIDTEGTENFILEGSHDTISRFKPIIICETLFNKIESELETIMNNHGYLFFNYSNGRLIKVETLVRETDNGIRDCFFVHPSKMYLIQQFIS